MNIKKYVLCQLADAQYEEERLVALHGDDDEDGVLSAIDAKIDAYENIMSYIYQGERDERSSKNKEVV